MDDWINLLDKWQPLIGAAVGGFFALLVEFIVAYDARRREERIAASFFIGALQDIQTNLCAIDAQAQKQGKALEGLMQFKGWLLICVQF